MPRDAAHAGHTLEAKASGAEKPSVTAAAPGSQARAPPALCGACADSTDVDIVASRFALHAPQLDDALLQELVLLRAQARTKEGDARKAEIKRVLR